MTSEQMRHLSADRIAVWEMEDEMIARQSEVRTGDDEVVYAVESEDEWL